MLEYFIDNDTTDLGILSILEAVNLIQKVNPQELKKRDVILMLKQVDTKRIGQLCYHSLAKKIIEFVQKNNSLLAICRRILSACIRKGPPLNNVNGFKQAFMAKDGKVTVSKFRMKLLEILPGLFESELKIIESEFTSVEVGKIDIKRFADELFSPELSKVSIGVSEYKKTKKEAPTSTTIGSTQQALKGKLEETKKENECLKKENAALYQRIAKIEKLSSESKTGFSKAVGKARPDIAQNEYSAKIVELERNNYELQKKVDIELKPLIEKYKIDCEKLKSDIKFLKLENLRLQSQIEKLLRKPMDGVEKQHELDNIKDTKISEQDKKIQELLKQIKQLEEKGFKLEQQKLELLFEKENFDLERARMERRIKDLEGYQAENKY